MVLYNLRPAGKEDYDFLYRLLRETMEQYYTETYKTWGDSIERTYFEESLANLKYQIIEYENVKIGCLNYASVLFLFLILKKTRNSMDTIINASPTPP